LTEAFVGSADATVFVGAGGAGVSMTDAASGHSSTSFVPTWSIGARGGMPMNRWLGVELEARRRSPIGDFDRAEYPSDGAWEYRAGLALRFGGNAVARVIPARHGVEASPRRPAAAPHTVSPVATDATSAPASAEDAAALLAASAIRTADQYVGTRYRWGGGSPADGFDCSGFVRYVFGQHGITLPRISRDQARAGRAMPTSLDGLAPGDLLFFAQRSATVDHVAIYAGEGRIVHASRSGYGVRYDELTGDRGRWYAQHLVAVRRVIDDAALIAADLSVEAQASDDADAALEEERGDEAAPPPATR
jgi:cell wall-associated NlpC family hydrolase